MGDFTSALAEALGCDFDSEKGKKGDDERGGKVSGIVTDPLRRVLPRAMVDGPSATLDETVLLARAGIGVTPFASILKSIWYRMNNMNISNPTCLFEVYFVWVIRDSGSAEWFHSPLYAIEEQDFGGRIGDRNLLDNQVERQ